MISFGVVTPSFNQARFLPAAMASVLAQQGDFSVDYRVMDGGSTDGSTDHLRRAEAECAGDPHRAFAWQSGPDAGQYAALQEGFAQVNGEVLCWLNSDDLYLPWAFSVVAEIFARHPEVEWLTSAHPMTFDEHGQALGVDVRWGYTAGSFRRWLNLPGGGHYARYFIQQDCTFWRRSLWEKAGGSFDTSLKLAADYELWLRFFEHAELYTVASPLAGYRLHPEQKTAQAGAYEAEAEQVMRRNGLTPCGQLASLVRRRAAPVLAALGLAPALARFGLADRVRTFKHAGRGRGWSLTERYIT